MRFTVTQKNLTEGIGSVLQVVPAKSTLPILSNILVVAEENKLRFSGTDLNMGIETTVEAEIEEAGSITMPAKRLNEIIRALPDQPIRFTIEDFHIKIECGRSVFKLTGIDAAEFPNFPEVKDQQRIELEADQFFRFVNKTAYAVSTDEMRPMLNGVFWRLTGDEMTMVSTDGHRLAKLTQTLTPGDVDVKEDKPIGVIIPPKALTNAQRLLGSFEKITTFFDANFIVFKAEDSLIYSRLIDGDYVNYDQVIPYSNDKELRVNRGDLLKAVKRVAIVADPLTHQINFTISPDKIHLQVESSELGEADEEISAEYTSEDMEIAYNSQYLIDVLSHFEGDTILFKLSAPTTAGLVVPNEDEENETFVCIIMPIRISE